MALAFDAEQNGRSTTAIPASADGPLPPRAGDAPEPNRISASQARAARRREALANEQAVAAWLRELSRRTR